ncbi:hypothetical protein ACLM5J_07400 [Nocardioides sp. Bht2]|uniref:hypothetical protein n=1 Tax=Nocardioides sp. Bht2 TaxID=3392297 RepID=UPI0039B5602B
MKLTITARTALAAVLLVGAGAGVAGWQAEHASRNADAGTEALAAAQQRVPLLLSYDAATLGDDLDRAVEMTTGGFRSEFSAMVADTVRPQAEKRGVSTSAEVTGAGIVSASADTVVVLCLIDQTTTGRSGRPARAISRVEVELVRVDDTWKIAGLKPV